MTAIADHSAPVDTGAGSEVRQFVTAGEPYYEAQFNIIGDKRGFAFTWNWAALVLGSIWFVMRSLWSHFLPFVALETFAIVQLARGIWGDLGAPILARLPGIENTLQQRYEQIAEAKRERPEQGGGLRKCNCLARTCHRRHQGRCGSGKRHLASTRFHRDSLVFC